MLLLFNKRKKKVPRGIRSSLWCHRWCSSSTTTKRAKKKKGQESWRTAGWWSEHGLKQRLFCTARRRWCGGSTVFLKWLWGRFIQAKRRRHIRLFTHPLITSLRYKKHWVRCLRSTSLRFIRACSRTTTTTSNVISRVMIKRWKIGWQRKRITRTCYTSLMVRRR